MARFGEEVCIGLVAIAGGWLYHIHGDAYLAQAVMGKDTAGTYIQVIAAALILCGVICLGKAAVFFLRRGTAVSETKKALSLKRIAGITGILIVYIILMPLLGFLAASVITGMALLVFMGERQPLRVLGLPIGFAVTIYLLFVQLLQVSLPSFAW